MKLQARARQGDSTCPLCQDELGSGAVQAACPGCQTEYHTECLVELGGCATVGCAQFRKTVRNDPVLGITVTPVVRPLSLRNLLFASAACGVGGSLMLGNLVAEILGPQGLGAFLVVSIPAIAIAAFVFLFVWSRAQARRQENS